jgi:hypothetical protein
MKGNLDGADSGLRNITAVGEVKWPATWSHPDSSEPATKERNSGIKMGVLERKKSRTSGFFCISFNPNIRSTTQGQTCACRAQSDGKPVGRPSITWCRESGRHFRRLLKSCQYHVICLEREPETFRSTLVQRVPRHEKKTRHFPHTKSENQMGHGKDKWRLADGFTCWCQVIVLAGSTTKQANINPLIKKKICKI